MVGEYNSSDDLLILCHYDELQPEDRNVLKADYQFVVLNPLKKVLKKIKALNPCRFEGMFLLN